MRRAATLARLLAALATSSGCSLLYPFDYGVAPDGGASDDASAPDAAAADVVLPCAEGTTRCGAACVDTATSPAHCGRCGAACPARDNATAVCADRACAFVCLPGYADCDGRAENGCEVDTRSSPSHCGRCGRACPDANHAVAVCAMGTCGVTCAASNGDCDGVASNGCEVNLRNSEAHCGACGRACAPPNADPSCAEGVCGVHDCAAGFGDCDRAAGNGCEVNVQSDPFHCGGCGHACGTGQACSNGSCVASCPAGTTNCSGACVNLSTDPRNCMRCGTVCPVQPLGVTSCAAGLCAIACAEGRANCDGAPANGCEVELASDASNCGRCNAACTYTGARGTCARGACALGDCNPGRGNCDAIAENGCEVDLQTSTTSCGACGLSCATPPHATAGCREGTCVIGACAAGFGDCDGARDNGCEVNLQTSATHCGACGVVCAAGSVCREGSCVAVCGRDGLPCCNGTCYGGLCILGGCHTLCGSNGQACCPSSAANGQCGPSLLCVGNPLSACRPCGATGQPCCAGNVCGGGHACTAGRCA